jgi:hypothetical protein
MSRLTTLRVIRFAIAAALAMGAAASVLAHPGPRVWIGSASGRLVTYTGDNDLAPTTFTPQRVFVGGVDPDTLLANGQLDEYPVPGTGIYATEFPGYQVRTDGNSGIATGTSFGFNLAGPLLVFDPVHHAFRTSKALYGNPGPAPQMSESAGSSIVTTSDGPVNGFNFFSYNTPSDHAHLVTTLFGDGQNPVDGPHAVYAVEMELTGGGGMAKSLPYYIIFGRDVPLDDPAFQEGLQLGRKVFVALPGDANLDGTVDTLDFNVLAANFGGTQRTWQTADFNFDGLVDTLDFNALAANFGRTSANATSGSGAAIVVPEPASLAGVGVCGAVLLRRRRHRAVRHSR